MARMERAEAFGPLDRKGLSADLADAQIVFSYAHSGQTRLRQALIRGAEILLGRGKLERLYRRWQSELHDPGETFFTAGVRALNLRAEVVDGDLAQLPRQGGLLVVANHPYGIIDGLMIGHLIGSRRRDVKLMVNSQLCRPPEAKAILLPVDFGHTAEARKVSAETRRAAVDWLDEGHVLVIFPAGGISTAPRPLDAQAVDAAWHPFLARLARRPGVRTVPMFVHGQNSRLFQIASHWSYPLRVALIFRETVRRIGRPVQLSIGAPVDCATLDKAMVVDALRLMTYRMAGPEGPSAAAEFVWPSRVTW